MPLHPVDVVLPRYRLSEPTHFIEGHDDHLVGLSCDGSHFNLYMQTKIKPTLETCEELSKESTETL